MNARIRGLTFPEWGWVALSLCLFSVCAFPWLSLPGPYQDELLSLFVVEPFAFGSALYSWEWGDTQIPIMVMSYWGGLKAILLQWYFAVAPATTEGFRCFGLVLGLATIVLTALFLRRHYSSRVAMAAVLLLATDASFIHTIRIDWGPVALMHLLKAAGLLLLSVWVSTTRVGWLAAGMFVFGVALWDKANFVWFLFALAATVLIVFPKEVFERLDRRTVVVAGMAVVLGALPLVVFNIDQRGLTASDTSRFEFNPMKLVAAKGTLDGSAVLWLTTQHELDDVLAEERGGAARLVRALGVAGSNLTWPLIVGGLLALPWTLGGSQRRGVLFALVLSVVNYAVMFPLEAGGGSAHHVAMLYPFPIVLAVASLAGLAERWDARRVFVVVATAAVLVNLSLNARYLAAFAYTGGVGAFSDGIYRLVDRASDEPEYRYHLLDWGMSTPLALLSHGRGFRFEEEGRIFYGLDPEAVQRERIEEMLRDPKGRFVVRGEERTIVPRGREVVDGLVREGRLQLIAEIHERTGLVAFEVYGAAE